MRIRRGGAPLKRCRRRRRPLGCGTSGPWPAVSAGRPHARCRRWSQRSAGQRRWCEAVEHVGKGDAKEGAARKEYGMMSVLDGEPLCFVRRP